GGLVIGWLRRDRSVVLATLVAVPCALLLCSSAVYLRYLYPLFPLFHIICSGLCIPTIRVWYRGMLFAVGVPLVLLNLYCAPTAGWILRDFATQALFSTTKREQLSDAAVPQRRLAEMVNVLSGRQAKVLYVGCPYGLGLEGESRYLGWYNF